LLEDSFTGTHLNKEPKFRQFDQRRYFMTDHRAADGVNTIDNIYKLFLCVLCASVVKTAWLETGECPAKQLYRHAGNRTAAGAGQNGGCP
jgi:hypothetical protein